MGIHGEAGIEVRKMMTADEIAETLVETITKDMPLHRLRLECEIIKRKGPVGVGKATATVDGKVAAVAEITFAMGECLKNKAISLDDISLSGGQVKYQRAYSLY